MEGNICQKTMSETILGLDPSGRAKLSENETTAAKRSAEGGDGIE